MMDISEKKFHRLFSFSMNKDLKLPLGALSLSKDFTNTDRGDLYPLVSKSADLVEAVEDNRYYVKKGYSERLFGQFFHYATYEIDFFGSAGFSFNIKSLRATLICDKEKITFTCGDIKEAYPLSEPLEKLIVSLRPGAFDVYSHKNGGAYFIKSFECEAFKVSDSYEEFKEGYVNFILNEGSYITGGSFYIDSGGNLADIRPLTYEDGSAILEGGKIFLTASIRIAKESFQGVFSWVPGTKDFELIGSIFYDAGDSRWCNDVAASIVYNRFTDKWNLWVCSFSHGHILGYSEFDGDPRYGINVIDITLVNKKGEDESISTFSGAFGDEDPSFIYDKEKKRWLMAVCRLDKETKKYRYRFYEAETPFTGHKFIGEGYEGEETGGSFVNIEGEIHFICGNSFKEKSNYRIYNKDGMKNAKFDFPDGGFRGWGTVIPVNKATRTEYYWLTFDRFLGSEYNWSYGNVYCFKLIH